MKIFSVFIIAIFINSCSNHKVDNNQDNYKFFSSLKASDLIGKWGEADEHATSVTYIKPVWEINNNSFCFIETSSCFDFRVKDNNLTVYSSEPIFELKNLSLIKDTLTYLDYNGLKQRMYRVK